MAMLNNQMVTSIQEIRTYVLNICIFNNWHYLPVKKKNLGYTFFIYQLIGII